ncbi:MAG: radical SAM family heme chaperone HemW [Clostridia bacterium]|nr:radical SAM family heme chaperone HemW [Clostridia bacterium]
MNSLYIHIPFCRSKCPYCDFYSLRADGETVEAYVNALTDRLKNPGTLLPEGGLTLPGRLDTVYFGGGTPSVIGGENIAKILDAAGKSFEIAGDAEITLECNPSVCSGELLETAAAAGVNRVSVGLQSAVDAERRALGRLAGRQEALAAVDNARAAGIDNISLDLMLGIPGQTTESLDISLDFIIETGVPHVSDYMLQLEEGTVFWSRREKLDLPSDDTVSEMYLHTVDRLKNAGIIQYEISNFARPGFESRHNMNYWLGGDYLGAGPAAHSFIGGKRFAFSRSVDAFINGERPEIYDSGGDAKEYIMLRLRLSEGIDFAEYEEKFRVQSSKFKGSFPGFMEKCRFYADRGLGELTDAGFRLTPRGFLVSNGIIADLIEFS